MSASSTLGILTEQVRGTDLSFQMVKVQKGIVQLTDQHQAELSDYWIGQYPVTQDLWQAVIGENPSFFEGSRRPVEQVSWYDCVEFCNALSEKQQLEPVYTIDKGRKDPNNHNPVDDLKWLVKANHAANGYRLPTGAEWEYAARGGRYARGFTYAGSNDLNEVGWYNKTAIEPPGQSDKNVPMNWAYLIYRAMYGNGAGTGTAHIWTHICRIPLAIYQVGSVSFAGVAGSTVQTSAVSPSVSTFGLIAATSASGFAFPGRPVGPGVDFLFFTFLPFVRAYAL